MRGRFLFQATTLVTLVILVVCVFFGACSLRDREKSTPARAPAPVEAAPPASRITGRSFLVGGQQEEAGYGLYSYLLLPEQPLNDDMRQRFLAVIDAYLKALPEVGELEKLRTRTELNITYLMITENPPKDSTDANWVLTHYNFARAKVLLGLLPAPAHNGPYVISTLRPLSHASHLPEHYLFQDMSGVPASMAGMWEQQFETQADNPDFWEENTRSQAVLKLRTLIANAALALPEVKSSATELASILGLRIAWH